MSHYHIRVSGAEAMEWEPFNTREEAEDAAQKRIRAGQTYTVEELGEGCTRCQAGNTDRPS
jgi:hypothetical protein